MALSRPRAPGVGSPVAGDRGQPPSRRAAAPHPDHALGSHRAGRDSSTAPGSETLTAKAGDAFPCGRCSAPLRRGPERLNPRGSPPGEGRHRTRAGWKPAKGDREGQGRGKIDPTGMGRARRPEDAAFLRSARSGRLHSRAGEDPQRLYGRDIRPAHRPPPASRHRAPRNSWGSRKRIRGRGCAERPSEQPGTNRQSARGPAPEGEGIRRRLPFVLRGFDLFKIH